MKKNTKHGALITYAFLVTSGILAAIGAVADLFGFAEGISKHKESILRVIGGVLSFLASNWLKTVLVFIILAVILFIYRRREKHRLEERQTRSLSWFAPEQRNTAYSGGAEYIYELKHFLRQKDVEFSWWAVTGVAGIGKTRLVIETLKDDEFSNADVQWIREFDDYGEDALKKRADAIMESRNYRNIIIAEDAQIYMDNIGTLINYLSGRSADEIGNHKIRLLLLIRMGEDQNLRDRYKQLESRSYQLRIQKMRYREFGDELRLEKYSEEDIAKIVKSYAVKTIKMWNQKALTDEQINDLQRKTVSTLKAEKVDPNHLRPLFAMFITDALIAGKAPMSWSRTDILEYAVVEREAEFIKWESLDLQEKFNRFVYDKITGIICLSIIRNGIAISDIDDIRGDLEEELKPSGITLKSFLQELQMLGKDGIIRTHMPDILAEYYVLRNLVINPDDSTVSWIIEKMCLSLEGVETCREKIRQDFDYLYDEIEDLLDDFYYAFFEKCSAEMAFGIIIKLYHVLDLSGSNVILLHEAIRNQIRHKANKAIIAKMLFNMINRMPEMENKHKCLLELERLANESTGETEIVYEYSEGLTNMIYYDPAIGEKRRCFSELERLAEENAGKTEIVHEYSKGLVNMLIAESEKEEKHRCLSELERLAKENTGETEIVLEYGNGLFNMICQEPAMKDRRERLSELKHLADENAGETEIVFVYSKGLYNMLYYDLDIGEKRRCLSELARLAEENAGETKIVYGYSMGLLVMINNDPEMEEKWRCLSELEHLAKENVKEVQIVLEYSKGLVDMVAYASEMEEKQKCLTELEYLAKENEGVAEIAFCYGGGLFNLSNSYSELEVKRRCLTKMEYLAKENAEITEISHQYCEMLFNMICDSPEKEEKRRCLSELERLEKENPMEAEVVLEYCKGLYNMRQWDDDFYEKYISELHRLLSNSNFAEFVSTKEPYILIYIRRELLDYEDSQNMMG